MLGWEVFIKLVYLQQLELCRMSTQQKNPISIAILLRKELNNVLLPTLGENRGFSPGTRLLHCVN